MFDLQHASQLLGAPGGVEASLRDNEPLDQGLGSLWNVLGSAAAFGQPRRSELRVAADPLVAGLA